MELTDSLKALFIETAKSLKGAPAACLWPAPSKNSGPAANAVRSANWAGAGHHSQRPARTAERLQVS